LKIRLKISIFGILMILILLFGDNRQYTIIALSAAVVHEFGHILMSLILKMKINSFSLNLFGARLGVALPMYSYKKELLLSLSGPLSNIICGIPALYIYINFSMSGTISLCFIFFAVACFFLAMLNLLPIKGFDGGRIFVCLSAPLIGIYASEKWLIRLSFLFIFVLWAISIYLMIKIGASLALFVFSSALFTELFINSECFKK